MFLRLIITNADTKKAATQEFKIACTIGKKLSDIPSGNGNFVRRIAPTSNQTTIVNTQTTIRNWLPSGTLGTRLGAMSRFDEDGLVGLMMDWVRLVFCSTLEMHRRLSIGG